MKKIYLFLFYLFCCITANSETVYNILGEYENLNKIYEIEYVQYQNSKYSEFPNYISLPLDRTDDNYNISALIDFDYIIQFKENLIKLKNKFIEYDSIAKANNIKEIDQIINLNFPEVDFRWYWVDKYYRATLVKMEFHFIRENSESYVQCIDNLKHWDNRYIDQFLFIRFYDPETIQKIIDILDINHINDLDIKLNETINTNKNLFK